MSSLAEIFVSIMTWLLGPVSQPELFQGHGPLPCSAASNRFCEMLQSEH